MQWTCSQGGDGIVKEALQALVRNESVELIEYPFIDSESNVRPCPIRFLQNYFMAWQIPEQGLSVVTK
jgi:hypothetical protein